MPSKVVICGAGFIGSHIARAFAAANPQTRIVLASRDPTKLMSKLSENISADLSPEKVDVTNVASLRQALQGAQTVISLVGVLHGSPAKFEAIQWKGAENVAIAAEEVGAKLVHFSAIGADPNSGLISPRTKGLGEQAVLAASPKCTIIRPSLVFGPGDSFFARFAKLSKFLPFLPVFGGGTSKFQPVFVGDVARLVELCSHTERPEVAKLVKGKTVEVGGPEIFTYREIMELVLKYSGRWRPIISMPFGVGKLQGLLFEQLPENILTITRDQVSQLQLDNIVDPAQKDTFPELLQLEGNGPRRSVHEVLPTYL
ncbi:NAD(P)-binding protein [Serendipita vermifera]|nr:NAD(P)-binding protein [Serendipita vermifera]